MNPMKDSKEMLDRKNHRANVSRRGLVEGLSAGLAGAVVADAARAQTLADVPDRGPGADLGAHSERSRFVKLDRIPKSTPGKRNVDPGDAINSKTPHHKLVGNITPTDLHYERSHSGVPDIDPAQHRLLIHGMVRKSLVFSVDDLMRMPSISRIVFIECTGNGWENWKKSDPDLTVQHTHGLVSTNEWTGVPLKFLIDLVSKETSANWMLAEGGMVRASIAAFRSRTRSWTRHSSLMRRTANHCDPRTGFPCGC